eukprot:COSAG02_NODE_14458_length_1269_cov_1.438462_3_plen_83_part_00
MEEAEAEAEAEAGGGGDDEEGGDGAEGGEGARHGEGRLAQVPQDTPPPPPPPRCTQWPSACLSIQLSLFPTSCPSLCVARLV